jgi:hypothetical protein
MRKTSFEEEIASLYRGRDASVARRILKRLEEHDRGQWESLAEDLAVRLRRVVTHRRHLFDDALSELDSVAKGRQGMVWLAVGDPCVSLEFSVPTRMREVPPDQLLEHVRTRRVDSVSNEVCEHWVSLLAPFYFEVRYFMTYDARTGSFLYSSPPNKAAPVVLRARAFLEKQGLKRLGRVRAFTLIDGVPARGRTRCARLFDLLFSDMPYWRWNLNSARFPMRTLRIGSNIEPTTGNVRRGVLDAALVGLRADWQEEWNAHGMKTRTLRLGLPEGTIVEIRQNLKEIVTTVREEVSRRHFKV